MAKPNLLICFDAFGTLFKPKAPIFQQYGAVARRCGLTGFNDDQVQASFRIAFKNEAKRHRNYGKATGLGATKWWTNVIQQTFIPLLESGQSLPEKLAPTLLHRFSSDEGYATELNLASTIKRLKKQNQNKPFDDIVVGVVTNSDDRVPDVLASFGLNVSPLRFGEEGMPPVSSNKTYDIDFHCMSYDVGVEKPDKLIFEAAEQMLAQVIASRNGKDSTEVVDESKTWVKIYVGDEYEKDVVGSKKAGWNPILFDVDGVSPTLPRLEDSEVRTITELFKIDAVIRVQSIQTLVSWLSGEQ